MSYPSLQEQEDWIVKAKEDGRLFQCKGTKNYSQLSPEACRKRQKQKTAYHYKSGVVFAGECYYLECRGCQNNKTVKKNRDFDNNAWKKTRACENRIDTWAKAEGFASTLEAILCVTRDIWHGEVAAMCGVSYCFFHNWVKKRKIPIRSRSETNRLMQKNLRMQRRKNDKSSGLEQKDK